MTLNELLPRQPELRQHLVGRGPSVGRPVAHEGDDVVSEAIRDESWNARVDEIRRHLAALRSGQADVAQRRAA